MSPEGLNIACRKLAMSAESRTSVVQERSGWTIQTPWRSRASQHSVLEWTSDRRSLRRGIAP